jgi:hypothetical protein
MLPITTLGVTLVVVIIGLVFIFGSVLIVLASWAMRVGREVEVGIEGPWLAFHLRIGRRRKSDRSR